MADNAVLGIQVKAEGADQAVKQLVSLDDKLKNVKSRMDAVRDGAKAMGDALKGLGDATKKIDAANGKINLAREKMKAQMADLSNAAKNAADKANALKRDGDAAASTADKFKELAKGGEDFKALADGIDTAIASIQAFEQSMLDAYKPLEEAREKLKFFQDNAAQTEETIQQLNASAADWGVSNTQLTKAAAELVKSDVDVSKSLEGVVKAAVASRNELDATAKTFAAASKGEADALKTLRDDYKLNLDQLKNYGFQLDKTGAVSAKTADRQKALAAALADIAKTQYADALAKQQETLTGSIKRLEDTMDTAKAAIGEAIAPSVIKLTNALADLVTKFNQMDPVAQKTITGLVAGAGSLALAALSVAKLVTTVGGAVAAYDALKLSLAKLVPAAGAATAATDAAAASAGAGAAATGKLAAAASAAINPLTITLGLTAAVANELIKMYEAAQKVESARLDKASKAQADYYQQVRAINNALKETGYRWSDVADASARVQIVDALKKQKTEVLDLNKALEAQQKHLAALKDEEKALEAQRAAAQTAATARSVLKGAVGVAVPVPALAAAITRGLGLDVDAAAIDAAYADRIAGNAAQQRTVRTGIRATAEADRQRKDAELRQKQWEEFQAAEEKRQEERAKKNAERAKGVQKELSDVTSAANGLTPTDQGIAKAKELLDTYQRMRVQNNYLITVNKDLAKEYDKGLAALKKQVESLEKQKTLAEQKAEAEKVFAAQTAKADALKGKSLEEQRQGLAEIAERYKDLIAADAAFSQNAENRKRAEAEIKKLTADRLAIEKEIAELQKTAQQKLAAAAEKEKQLAIDRAERAAEHAEKMGDTAAADQYRKEAATLRSQQDDMRYKAAQADIYAKYDQLLAKAQGNDALTSNLLRARGKELSNLSAERQAAKQAQAWEAEERSREMATSARQTETAQIDKTAAAADRLATSLDHAAAAAEKQANHEYGGIKSYVESGKPVEIISRPDQAAPGEPWQQQAWQTRRDMWDRQAWAPTIDAIRQQQAAITQDPILPAYGTPIPRGYEGRAVQQQQTTYNLTVNGLNAAGAGTVDYMQMIDGGARMAARMVSADLNKQFNANSLI